MQDHLELTLAILEAMTLQIMRPWRDQARNQYLGKDGFFLIISTLEVTLVGGSGPSEGHIFVNGLPVCDDGHNDQNALVVCRFVETQSFWLKKLIILLI